MHHQGTSSACACGRPRGCNGRLPTCLTCLRVHVDRERQERAARQRRAKPTTQQAKAASATRTCV